MSWNYGSTAAYPAYNTAAYSGYYGQQPAYSYPSYGQQAGYGGYGGYPGYPSGAYPGYPSQDAYQPQPQPPAPSPVQESAPAAAPQQQPNFEELMKSLQQEQPQQAPSKKSGGLMSTIFNVGKYVLAAVVGYFGISMFTSKSGDDGTGLISTGTRKTDSVPAYSTVDGKAKFVVTDGKLELVADDNYLSADAPADAVQEELQKPADAAA